MTTPEQIITRLAGLTPVSPALAPPSHDRKVAAVLVAMLPDQPGCPVVFTRRATRMRHHAGEISLPGGLLEDQDEQDVIRAALREAREELGLDAGAVKVHTVLPQLHNSRGVDVYPVLVTHTRRPAWHLNPDEVSEVLEVPLAFFMDETHYLPRHRYYRGELRDTLVMEYEGTAIWGLTARIMQAVRQSLTH